ncbi:MAG: hypothetical protein WAN65_23230 [Candidatus Sulfotelmatobacter sp.]
MTRVSPTLEGFRAALRRPLLTFAEISWRWTIGATSYALVLYGFFEYLNTLPVSKSDAALLASRQPALAGRAIAHIFRGSMSRAVMAALCAGLALSLLWIVAASIGRTATVRALLDYFREKFASEVSNGDSEHDELTEAHEKTTSFLSLIGLNFLRVALVLAALLALLGAAIVAGFASSKTNPQPGLAFVLFLPATVLICSIWSMLSWLLSLAGVFAIRDGQDAMGALFAAIDFCRDRTGAVFAVSTWTGLAHFVAFSIASTAVSLPLAFLQVVPARLVLAVILLVTLAYFAVVDWLYMARLAGYVCILEMPEAIVASEPRQADPPAEPFTVSTPVQTTIDLNEPILSDLPSPAGG